MATSGDVIQIKVTQLVMNQELVNTFYYQVGVGLTPTVADCLSEFKDTVWDVVRDCVASFHVTTGFLAINGMDNTEFVSESVGDQGNNATGGQQLPPNIAVALRSSNGGPGKRYSYKWFSGLKADMIATAGGQFINTYEATLATLSAALGAVLEGTDGLYVPVQITGGFKLGTPPVVSRTLAQPWVFNKYPVGRRTRQNYAWELPE